MSLRHFGSHPVLIIVLAAGCASDAPDNQPDTPQSESRPWAPGIQLETVLEATSGDDLHLSYVEDADVDSRGRVYVADQQTRSVIVLKPDLTVDRNVGREGEGPSEFQRVSSVQVLSGDSLMVYDGALDRVSVFAPDSAEAAYQDDLRGVATHGDVWRLPGTSGYLEWYSPPYMASGSDAGQVRMDVLKHIHGEEERGVDSLFSFPSGASLVIREESGDGAVSMARHPFGQRSFVQILDGATVVHATSAVVAATIIHTSGRVESAFSFETTPIGVTRSELRSAADRLSRELSRMLRDDEPYTWPPLTGLVVDDAKRIWVGIRKMDRATWEWAAFTHDGSHVASVDLPTGFMVYSIRGDRVIGLYYDQLGVPRFQAYRLTGIESAE